MKTFRLHAAGVVPETWEVEAVDAADAMEVSRQTLPRWARIDRVEVVTNGCTHAIRRLPWQMEALK